MKGKMILQGLNHDYAAHPHQELSHLDWQHAWNVLDLGCGDGVRIARMMELCPQGLIYGIDAAEKNVASAREYNAKELDKRCFILQGKTNNLPFDVDTFDVVTALDPLSLQPDWEKTFTEVYRVLKPGGYFLLCCESGKLSTSLQTERIKEMKMPTVDEIKAQLTATDFVDILTYNSEEENICITAREGKPDDL